MSAACARPAAAGVPRVWVVASHRVLANEHGHPQPYTLIDEGGTLALVELGLQPLSYPRVPTDRIGELLDTVHGVFLGGSATNVHPRQYAEMPSRDGLAFDHERDALSLPLARLCVERGVPVLGVCRGSHELNVAFGGSLHQELQRLGHEVVHWEDPDEPLAEQYAERHGVTTVAGGALERITGCGRLAVSSLHSQGVRRLGEGWVVEARSDDGLVEAFRWHDPSRFAWGFQFHPEWGHARREPYARIMAAFVDACRAGLARQAEEAATCA